MRMAAGKGLTTPALMVNGLGHAPCMITQGDRHLARKGSMSSPDRNEAAILRPPGPENARPGNSHFYTLLNTAFM